MSDELLTKTLDEIKTGYSYDDKAGKYHCNICGKEFETGEIFIFSDKYFEASKAIRLHIEKDHLAMIETLMSYDKKYTSLTDNQKELLALMKSGFSDNEIAKKLAVAPSTIRHQRFIFKEKAKQAKLYLAIYELTMQTDKINEKKAGETQDEIIDIHSGATMIDDRYFTTISEQEKILASVFESLEPLKLKVFSSKEKKKIVILKKIAAQFVRDKRYSEKEINCILEEIYADYATIRRYLIEYGFMGRTNDGKEYWLI